MKDSRNIQPIYWSAFSCMVCLLLSVDLNNVGATHYDPNYNDSHYNHIIVEVLKPGQFFSPGSVEHGTYDNNMNMVWIIRVSDPDNMALFLYPTHMDLETCCDIITVTEFTDLYNNGTIVPGQDTWYSGDAQAVHGRDSLRRLKQLPIVQIDSGYVRMLFRTDSSVTLTGFAFRYFAKAKYIEIPSSGSPLQALPEVKQLSVQKRTEMQEFSIEAPVGQRIWLQVVHMNGSLSAIDIEEGWECRFQYDSLRIMDNPCSVEECQLLRLCRSPYSITPTTVVTYGNIATIYFICDQPLYTDCAVINYKIYNETGLAEVISGCPVDTDAPSYMAIGDGYWFIEHSFYVSSLSSDLDRTWWIQNVHVVEELTISVIENRLVRSPDCSVEKVEIYSGSCVVESNLLTYFCGGVRDTYKLTNSRFAVVRFISHPITLNFEHRHFRILIKAGYLSEEDRPPDYPPDYYNPIPEWQGFPGLDPYTSIVVLVIAAAIIAAAIAVCIRYNAVKRRQSGHRIQAAAKSAAEEVVRSMDARKMSEPPPGIPLGVYSGTTFDSAGVPPPAIYNPPPLHDPSRPPPLPVQADPISSHMLPSSQIPVDYGHPTPPARNIVVPYPRQ